MVLFFSGTGNSKFVAQKVAEILNDEARDISDYLKRKQIPDFTEDGVYVFVAPSYVSAPARAMIDFIDQATFPEGIKVYFLITCVASMGVSPEVAKRLSEKKGFKYMGSAQIDMPQNYIIYFKTKEAIEYGKGTVGKPRYPGPFDTLKKRRNKTNSTDGCYSRLDVLYSTEKNTKESEVINNACEKNRDCN